MGEGKEEGLHFMCINKNAYVSLVPMKQEDIKGGRKGGRRERKEVHALG